MNDINYKAPHFYCHHLSDALTCVRSKYPLWHPVLKTPWIWAFTFRKCSSFHYKLKMLHALICIVSIYLLINLHKIASYSPFLKTHMGSQHSSFICHLQCTIKIWAQRLVPCCSFQICNGIFHIIFAHYSMTNFEFYMSHSMINQLS